MNEKTSEITKVCTKAKGAKQRRGEVDSDLNGFLLLRLQNQVRTILLFYRHSSVTLRQASCQPLT